MMYTEGYYPMHAIVTGLLVRWVHTDVHGIAIQLCTVCTVLGIALLRACY